MNEKFTEILKEEIEYLKRKEEEADKEQQYLYDKRFEDLRQAGSLFVNDYDYRIYRNLLERNLEFYTKLTEANIDLEKPYMLTDNIMLKFSTWSGHLQAYFYLKDDSWLYDNFIDSHSGLNEWITDLINDEHALFSGNSRYCHAFRTCELKHSFDYIYDKENKYSTSLKVQEVQGLIDFVEGNGDYAKLKQAVVEMLEFRFQKMKECLTNE